MVKKKRRKYGLSTHSFNCTRFPFPTSIVFKKKRNRRLSGSPGTEWSTTGIAYSASCTRVVKYRLQQDMQQDMIRMIRDCPRMPTSTEAIMTIKTYEFCSIKIESLQFATRRHLPKFAESKHGVGTCFIEKS